MGKKPSKMTILFFLGNQRLKELREWKSARKMCWKPGFLFPLSKKHLVTLFPSIPEGKTSIIPATPTITIPSFMGNTVHSGFQKIIFISFYLVFIFFMHCWRKICGGIKSWKIEILLLLMNWNDGTCWSCPADILCVSSHQVWIIDSFCSAPFCSHPLAL